MENNKTDPSTLPKDVLEKLLAIRDALLNDNLNEAYHQLYSIADPEFSSYFPWDKMEEALKNTE